ncbi:MAG: DUF2726 domain-containing protein [Undibacterium curvum]|uniref:DUF2726 domain-containing protein n=1 Tax=Undibacterium curvum TaxID=2762294 RepID=UPI003BC10725
MKYLAFTLTLLLLMWIASRLLRKQDQSVIADTNWPYCLRRPLGAAEQILFHRLTAALPEHIVLSQVQMSRILGVKKGANLLEWHQRINQLSFDYVICNKDFSVLAVIELNDGNGNPHRHETDYQKTKACKDAGLRLIHWHVKLLPDEAAIRAAFSEPVITRSAHPEQIDREFKQIVAQVQ